MPLNFILLVSVVSCKQTNPSTQLVRYLGKLEQACHLQNESTNDLGYCPPSHQTISVLGRVSTTPDLPSECPNNIQNLHIFRINKFRYCVPCSEEILEKAFAMARNKSGVDGLVSWWSILSMESRRGRREVTRNDGERDFRFLLAPFPTSSPFGRELSSTTPKTTLTPLTNMSERIAFCA